MLASGFSCLYLDACRITNGLVFLGAIGESQHARNQSGLQGCRVVGVSGAPIFVRSRDKGGVLDFPCYTRAAKLTAPNRRSAYPTSARHCRYAGWQDPANPRPTPIAACVRRRPCGHHREISCSATPDRLRHSPCAAPRQMSPPPTQIVRSRRTPNQAPTK